MAVKVDCEIDKAEKRKEAIEAVDGADISEDLAKYFDIVPEVVIAKLMDAVSRERIARLEPGFEYDGIIYHMDDRAQAIYTEFSVAILAGRPHENIVKPKGKSKVVVDDDTAIAIGEACRNAAGAINIVAWDTNDIIRDAEDFATAWEAYRGYMG